MVDYKNAKWSNIGWQDKSTFTFQFGDFEDVDNEKNTIFVLVEYHADTKSYVFQLWFESKDSGEAGDVITYNKNEGNSKNNQYFNKYVDKSMRKKIISYMKEEINKNRNVFEVQVDISKQDYEKYDKMLKSGADIKELGLEKETTYYSISNNFSDGTEGEISIFTGKNNIMCSYYLFNAEKNIEYTKECDDSMFNNYIKELPNGDIYVIRLNIV